MISGAERMAVKFDIFRFEPGKDAQPRRQKYEVAATKDLTVLDALRQIQDHQDGTLAFRASCDRGLCGSCAMEVNGRIRLACETRIRALRRKQVRVNPLPGYPVIRDLMVDMRTFWEKYRRVRPWLTPDINYTKREHVQSPDTREKLDAYVRCIWCGACEAVCPETRRRTSFLGPAALAKVYRLIEDSRETDSDDRLAALDCHDGVWGCDATFRCVRVCPRGVPPTHAITAMRRALVGRWVRRRFLPFLSRESVSGTS